LDEEWYSLTPKIDVQLPDHLIEKIEVAAEVLSKSRTEIVEKALRQYLEELEGDEEFKEAAVELYLHDEIRFELLKQIIGQQDAESAWEAKTLLKQGEDLGDGFADILSD
jgi:metal-responsive CopG/Arc/MetJ family transcriptional regulator